VTKTLWAKVFPSDPAQEAEFRLNSDVLEAPPSAMFMAAATTILGTGLGFAQSAERMQGLWGDGSPVPLMSYSLIEYLMAIDLSDFDLLEVGGGSSTLFWASRVKSVMTIETDQGFIDTLRQSAPANVTFLHSPAETIPAAIHGLDRGFDLIAVDCASSRYAAAKAALPSLRPGGFILLDNSDWYPNTSSLLRDANLIQVDFPDFRPAHHFRCVTSLFLHPDFRPRPKFSRMPPSPVGGKDLGPVNRWDQVTD